MLSMPLESLRTMWPVLSGVRTLDLLFVITSRLLFAHSIFCLYTSQTLSVPFETLSKAYFAHMRANPRYHGHPAVHSLLEDINPECELLSRLLQRCAHLNSLCFFVGPISLSAYAGSLVSVTSDTMRLSQTSTSNFVLRPCLWDLSVLLIGEEWQWALCICCITLWSSPSYPIILFLSSLMLVELTLKTLITHRHRPLMNLIVVLVRWLTLRLHPMSSTGGKDSRMCSCSC